MRSTTKAVRLTPAARIGRGLKNTAMGPVDVTRGVLGVGVSSTRASASWAANRYRVSRLKDQLGAEFAAAQDAITNLPQAIHGARESRRRRPKPVVVLGIGAAVLAVGAVSFSIIRRSTQPEPSPLRPSVDVAPSP